MQIVSIRDWDTHFAYVPGFSAEDLPYLETDDHVGFYETVLPSGTTAFFLVHSGIEYLFVLPGTNLDAEIAAIEAMP